MLKVDLQENFEEYIVEKLFLNVYQHLKYIIVKAQILKAKK